MTREHEKKARRRVARVIKVWLEGYGNKERHPCEVMLISFVFAWLQLDLAQGLGVGTATALVGTTLYSIGRHEGRHA